MRLSVGRLGCVLVLAAAAACRQQADAPAGEDPLAVKGEMTLVSAEPIDLPLLAEMNLIETGDFEKSLTWRIGAASPNGFDAPDETYSSLEKAPSNVDGGFVVRQTWKERDVGAPLASRFNSVIREVEAGKEYALEITASGAARVNLWNVNNKEHPRSLDRTLVCTYPGLKAVKRYTKRFQLDGGRFAASASSCDKSPTGGIVRWHSWRLTTAPAAAATGQAPSPPGSEEAAAPQEQHDPGATQQFGGIDFVWCPPGQYLQGAGASQTKLANTVGGLAEWYSDEYPQHAQTIDSGFWITKTEITSAQWRSVMAPAKKGDTRPVVSATWTQCQDFATAFSESNEGTFSLPTETQWEYACRAGTASLFSFGDDPAELAGNAWYLGNVSAVETQAVGGKAPNAWGLHDMHGNVWEWCRDEYASYGAGSPRPMTGFRVIRGGSVATPANFTRSASRFGLAEDEKSKRVGFRLVCQP